MGLLRRYATRMFLVATLLGVVSPSAGAQSFRGEVVYRSTVPSADAIVAEISAGQILLVSFDGPDARFLSGLDISVRAPQRAPRPGSFSIAVYGSVDAPTAGQFVNLAGRPLGTVPLADEARYRLWVPLHGDATPAAEPGIQRLAAADRNTGSVAIQLVPVMKGMNSRDLDRQYRVTVSPVLRPVGGLEVVIGGEPDILELAQPSLQVSLAGEPISPGRVIERSPGIYRLEVQAGDYLSYTGNIGIEQGEIRRVNLEAREPHATVRLSVPSISEVYWNGTLVSERGDIRVSPGDHTLMVRLGDFSVSRQVSLAANESYEVAIDLDILLNED